MNHERVDAEVARRSAWIYLPAALGAALLFLLAASLVGTYPLVARVGGAVWVGILTLIVTMPLVTTHIKGRLRTAADG
jgi:hypothetical protein